MITILQNQHICKRKRTYSAFKKEQFRENPREFKQLPFLFSSSNKRTKRYVLKLPVISGVALFILCIFVSAPHIFSLSLSKKITETFQLPDESSLIGYPDGYEYVANLQDEREFGIIRIVHEDNNHKEYPSHYIVKKGDSVYSISREYNISLYDILRENRISDPTKLKIGDILKFPVFPGENTFSRETAVSYNPGTNLPEDIEISVDKKSGIAPLKVTFNLNTELKAGTDDEPFSFMWVLGNDRYVFDKQAEYTYTNPGLYNAFLIVSGNRNKEVVSNKIDIEVKKENVRRLRIETKNQQYITVNQINKTLTLSDLAGLPGINMKEPDMKITQSPELLQHLGNGQFLSTRSGYSRITVLANTQRYVSYVFVSPIPSKHSWEPPFDWYKTQFATGITGNCGPASVAMAILWATGEDVPVAKIRSEIGLPNKNGAINLSHMFPSFKKRRINAYHTFINNPGDVRNIIDRGNIAIIVFNTRTISKTKGDIKKNFTGRYYDDITGHYCIIKGYTPDGKYFIVYDPIPSDWTGNSARYSDGVSMIGKNRYYSVSELFRTIGKKVIEITRNP
ncbi:MAG: LysM peptidoglycan-binding domain-containing protein [Spirochaetales bacterium]|nr:LysM peptidoglycan-binding domain-containing protein [Spirochaetales bacterium]